MVVIITSGEEEKATDLRGFRLDERQDLRSGAGGAVIGEIGDGRTPNLLGSGGGMARESLWRGFAPIVGLAMLLACGRAVISLSLVIPGRGDGVGNLMPEAGGRNGEVQLGLGRTTVLPFDDFEW